MGTSRNSDNILTDRMAIYIAFIVLLLLSFGFFNNPFLAHDDIDWLLPKDYNSFFESPWNKTRSEGRWINFIWYYFSKNLSIKESFFLYLPIFGSFFYLLSGIIDNKTPFLPILLLLSPTSATLITYPSTLFLGFLLITIIIYFISILNNWKIILILSCMVFYIGYMTYPIFGSILLMALVASKITEFRRWVQLVLCYIFSVLFSVITIFSLNYFNHGVFGIIPAGWRKAKAASNFNDILSNSELYIISIYNSISNQWEILLASLIGYSICIIFRINRASCLFIILTTILLFSIDATLSILNGLPFYLRAALWLWLFYCIPVIFIIKNSRYRYIGYMLFLVLLAFGLSQWQWYFGNKVKLYPMMDTIGTEIVSWKALHSEDIDKIQIYGDAKQNPELVSLHSNRMLRNYLFRRFNISSTPCKEEICEYVQNLGNVNSNIIVTDRTLIFILSQKPDNRY